MNDNTFYGEDVYIAQSIPIIAISIFDGSKYGFPSLTCAAERLNVTVSGISKCLRGEQYQTGGYFFKYADRTYAERSNRKPVAATNLEDGSEQVFQSVRMAGKELGVHSSYISRALHGGKNYMPNYSFRYATDEDSR